MHHPRRRTARVSPLTAAPHWHLFLSLYLAFSVTACGTFGPITVDEQPAVLERLEKPKICVALSDGGLRSAAFSTGVLRSLYLDGALHKVDILSATSGGAWSVLWLHARLADGNSLADIYGVSRDVDTSTIRELETRSFIGPIWKAWTVAWGPMRAAFAAYYASIASKFGRPFQKTSIAAINNNIEKHRIPVPVINVSSFRPCNSDDSEIKRYGADGPQLAERMQELMPFGQHLIELTPQYWGSKALGYSSTFPFEVRNMEDWARVASAAVDAPGYRNCEALRALGITFGAHVPTPETSSARTVEQKKIFLADGGFVDNLAARSLFDRGCETVLISDAEHDPTLNFEAYRRLQKDLSTDGKRLIVSRIDDWILRRGPDRCPKDGPCFQADNAANGLVNNSAFEGCLTTHETCEAPGQEPTRVIYLKLSIDPLAVNERRLNPAVTDFYLKSINGPSCKEPRGTDADCSFPHTPTFKTNYGEEEYRAYRLLGEDIMRLNRVSEILIQDTQNNLNGF